MSFKSVMEVLEKTDLVPLFSFTQKGMWFTPLTETENNSSKNSYGLGIKSFEEKIKVPAEVFRRKGQMEQYYSALYFKLAVKFINALLEKDAKDSLVSLPAAAVVTYEENDPMRTMDLLRHSSYVNESIYFNSTHTVESEFTKVAGDRVFPFWFNADTSTVRAFSAVPQSYNLYLSDVDIEEDKNLSNNEITLVATMHAQGYPSISPVIVDEKKEG